MIDDLLVGKTAAFYAVRRKLTARTIDELFNAFRNSHVSASKNIFRHAHEVRGNSRWSAICFTYASQPAFLGQNTKVLERLCGYFMLVEYRDHVAVFSSRLSLPSSFKSNHLLPVAVSLVEAAIAKQGAIFQKLRLRNMSVSQHTMRSKTLEAADLSNVVGPSGSRRYVPQGYAVALAGVHTTATPSTGRISIRSDRVGHEELIQFAEGVIDEFSRGSVSTSPFIRTFARPMTLAGVLAVSNPITLAVDTSQLIEAVTGDVPSIRLFRSGGNPRELTAAEFNNLLEEIEKPLDIRGKKKRRMAYVSGTKRMAASISLNQNRIALRSLDLPVTTDIEVETAVVAVGQGADRRTLCQYLDENDTYVVLFDDTRLAYINGTLFRDETLQDGGEAFLRYFHVQPALAAVVSEKGTFSAAKANFDHTSTFGVIVQDIAANDQILICDDLNDEWADFIGVKIDNGLTQVSFYHGKHGNLGLGAGQFHVAVSQAIKNLGNMSFPTERMPTKIQGWSNFYTSDHVGTQIRRIVRTNVPDLSASFAQARTAPDSIRRAIIVTSSISKQALENALTHVQNGGRPTPSFVQLYWLLQSFFSACTEVGAIGSIMCQP